MVVTRRAVLKTFAATGIGALTGTGFYGFAYARHQLEITRADVPVARLPAALAASGSHTRMSLTQSPPS